MAELIVRKGRTEDFTIALYESDGSTAVTIAASDVVRCKLGRRGVAPVLDIDSVGALAGGSIVTFTSGTNNATLRIAQGDTASLESGTYNLEVSLVDDSDSDKIKHAQTHVVHLLDSPLGDVALV